MKKVAILGSTGSIGIQSLAVCRAMGYRITALTANRSVDLLEEQVRAFRPSYAVFADESAAQELARRLADLPVKVLGGEKGVC